MTWRNKTGQEVEEAWAQKIERLEAENDRLQAELDKARREISKLYGWVNDAEQAAQSYKRKALSQEPSDENK